MLQGTTAEVMATNESRRPGRHIVFLDDVVVAIQTILPGTENLPDIPTQFKSEYDADPRLFRGKEHREVRKIFELGTRDKVNAYLSTKRGKWLRDYYQSSSFLV